MRQKVYGAGSLWMILLYVTLCLTIFSALTLLAAKRNESLTNKNIASIQHYYKADLIGKEIWMEIQSILEENNNDESFSEAIKQLDIPITFEVVSEKLWCITYQVPCGERQQLKIQVEIEREEDEMRSYINEWAVIASEEWQYESDEISFDEQRIGEPN